MAKTKTSQKRPKFSTKGLTKHSPNYKLMADARVTLESLLDCLVHNDLENFRIVLVGYLNATSKLGLSKKTGLGRRTLYDLIDSKKPFNPTIKTLGAIFESLAA